MSASSVCPTRPLFKHMSLYGFLAFMMRHELVTNHFLTHIPSWSLLSGLVHISTYIYQHT